MPMTININVTVSTKAFDLVRNKNNIPWILKRELANMLGISKEYADTLDVKIKDNITKK